MQLRTLILALCVAFSSAFVAPHKPVLASRTAAVRAAPRDVPNAVESLEGRTWALIFHTMAIVVLYGLRGSHACYCALHRRRHVEGCSRYPRCCHGHGNFISFAASLSVTFELTSLTHLSRLGACRIRQMPIAAHASDVDVGAIAGFGGGLVGIIVGFAVGFATGFGAQVANVGK